MCVWGVGGSTCRAENIQHRELDVTWFSPQIFRAHGISTLFFGYIFMLHLTQNTACLLHFVQFGQFRVKSLCHCNQTAQEFAWNQTETTVLRHSQTRQDPYLSKHNYRGCSTRVPFKLTKLSTCNKPHSLLVVALFSLGPATTCHTITAACSWSVRMSMKWPFVIIGCYWLHCVMKTIRRRLVSLVGQRWWKCIKNYKGDQLRVWSAGSFPV